MASSTEAELASAYASCARLARAHYENFPVASWILPRQMRPHIAAIYMFARIADDFADEGTVEPEERLQRLDAWRRRLRQSLSSVSDGSFRSHAVDLQSTTAISADQKALFLALANTIQTRCLPVTLFEDLLSAFEQDVVVHRYQSWDQLLDYCSRSANPVGRLVLRVAGHNDPSLDRASDCLCTALQLTNFWQDFARDYSAGRLYLPADTSAAVGADEADLDGGRLTPAWQEALALVSARTRDLFLEGRDVCDGVGGRLSMELRLTWLGGLRVLERLEHNGFDVFARRPTLGWRDGAVMLWRTMTWAAAKDR